MKIPVHLRDGLTVEAVFYGRDTLCISSQAGCALGCPFCASGARGFFRSLTAEELSDQVALARERGFSPSRVTVSGIGEPLHNVDAVQKFQIWCRGQNLPVSVTTTGSPLAVLKSFLPEWQGALVFSLHAGTAAVHRKMVPRGPDYESFWALLQDAWLKLSRRRRRTIGVNYLLLEGVNDSQDELAALGARLRVFPEITLHLLTLNQIPGAVFSSPSADRLAEVHSFLSGSGLNVRRANRWRRQIEGGCGTLLAGGISPGGSNSIPMLELK